MDSLSPSKWKLLWKEGKFPGAAAALPAFGGGGGGTQYPRQSHREEILILENSEFRIFLPVPWRITTMGRTYYPGKLLV